MTLELDKEMLLGRLERVSYKQKPEDSRQRLSKVSLGSALLTLANISAEDEYLLCNRVAEHLIGEVPNPPEVALDDARDGRDAVGNGSR
jgi:hypothetical protein